MKEMGMPSLLWLRGYLELVIAEFVFPLNFKFIFLWILGAVEGDCPGVRDKKRRRKDTCVWMESSLEDHRPNSYADSQVGASPENANMPQLTSPHICLALHNLPSTSRCVISFGPPHNSVSWETWTLVDISHKESWDQRGYPRLQDRGRIWTIWKPSGFIGWVFAMHLLHLLKSISSRVQQSCFWLIASPCIS